MPEEKSEVIVEGNEVLQPQLPLLSEEQLQITPTKEPVPLLLSDNVEVKSRENLTIDEFNDKTVESNVLLLQALYEKMCNFNENRTPSTITDSKPKIYKEFIGDINLNVSRKPPTTNPSFEKILNIERAQSNFKMKNSFDMFNKTRILKSINSSNCTQSYQNSNNSSVSRFSGKYSVLNLIT